MTLHKQRGVNLVELMVASVIGLILIAGVLSIFVSSKMTYFSNEKMARLQENGRVALNLVSYDVRASGYSGCARAVPFTSSLNSSTTLLWNYAIPLQGFENTGTATWAPTVGITLAPAAVDNSDIIVARTVRRDTIAMRVESDLAGLTSDPAVLTTMASAPTVGQIMMITDCTATSVFQVTGYTAGSPNSTIQHASGGSSPGNSTGELGNLYRAGSRVASLQTVIYYVGNDPATGEPALYRQIGAGAAELLIEGVEAIQFAYGLDTNGDRLADQYVAANNVTNWDNVLSVNYALLVRSEEIGSQVDAKTYQLLPAAAGGRTLGPFSDRRSRMVFTSTIALRNRAL
jgi:type IV pilus assembly protein PilW